MKYFFLGICVFNLLSCGASNSTSNISAAYPYSTPSQYFKVSQKITVEVYYEAGAEPFIGNNAFGRAYWGILEDNINKILSYRSAPPIVVVPKVLSEMHPLSASGKTLWTGLDIIDLNRAHREADSSRNESRFYIYFVNGNYSDGASAQNGVIGVSIGGTPVIAVFKDVIRNSGGAVVQRYVEQSTLVHELGHALGFVNNGVPMVVPHQDTAHGKHASDNQCVMYWLNEGASDLQSFIVQYMTSGNNIMWGSDVLNDAAAYSE